MPLSSSAVEKLKRENPDWNPVLAEKLASALLELGRKDKFRLLSSLRDSLELEARKQRIERSRRTNDEARKRLPAILKEARPSASPETGRQAGG